MKNNNKNPHRIFGNKKGQLKIQEMMIKNKNPHRIFGNKKGQLKIQEMMIKNKNPHRIFGNKKGQLKIQEMMFRNKNSRGIFGNKKGQLKIQEMMFRNKNSRRIFGNNKGQLKIQEMMFRNKNPHRIFGNKKGQLKIQEMMFMLVGVFMFFILVGLFASIILYSGIKESSREARREKVINAISSLSDSPEFYCGKSRSNCIDEDKLIILNDKGSFNEFWPFNSLKIIRYSGLSKSFSELKNCTIGNYPDCDYYDFYTRNKNESSVASYVALCRIESENGYNYEKCEIGKIIAGVAS